MKENIKVRIDGEVFLYDDKAPFMKSDFGDKGALRLDISNDLVMCHECGRWFKNLSQHVWRSHDMNVSEYKIKHGLKMTSCLVNETLRVVRSTNAIRLLAEGKMRRMTAEDAKRGRLLRNKPISQPLMSHETQNMRGSCDAQLIRDLQDLATKLKRTPTGEEIFREIGLCHSTATYRFGGYKNLILLAGLEPRLRGCNLQSYRTGSLIRTIRSFWRRHRRVASGSDFRRGLLPSESTLRRRFGSIKSAFVKAVGEELNV